MKKLKRCLYALVLSVLLLGVIPVQHSVLAAVKLSAQTLYLIKGQRADLDLIGTTAKVTWSSTDKKIAIVGASGNVKAKANGTCYIVAKVGNASYKCKVTVETPKINKRNLTLEIGKSYRLKVSGTKQKVTWYSYDNDIAKVNNSGKVTAIKSGSATIAAFLGDDLAKIECKVTVKLGSIRRYLERPVAQSRSIRDPLNLDSDYFEMDRYGNIKVFWNSDNLSRKRIKYYHVKLEFVNSVGDPAYDRYTGKSYTNLTFIGPIEAYGTIRIGGTYGCVPTCDKILISEVKLEFYDGTVVEGLYNYYIYRFTGYTW